MCGRFFSNLNTWEYRTVEPLNSTQIRLESKLNCSQFIKNIHSYGVGALIRWLCGKIHIILFIRLHSLFHFKEIPHSSRSCCIYSKVRKNPPRMIVYKMVPYNTILRYNLIANVKSSTDLGEKFYTAWKPTPNQLS